MAQNKHYRNGVHRKRWTCPFHKGLNKTIVGKPCPTCGFMGKVATRLVAEALVSASVAYYKPE